MANRPRHYDQRNSRRNQIQPSEESSASNNHGPKRASRQLKSTQDDILSKFNVYTGEDKSKDKINDKSSGLEKYNVYSGDINADKALSKYNVYDGNNKQRSKESSRLDKYNVYSGDTKPTKPRSQDPNKKQGGDDFLDRYKVYTGDEAKVSDSRHRVRPNTYSDAEVVRSSGDDVAAWSSARNSGAFEGYYSDRSNHLPAAGGLWGMAEDMDNREGGWDPGAMSDGSHDRLDGDQQYYPQDDGTVYDDDYYDEYEEDLMNMPSQMFMAGTGTVRYRTVGRQRQRVMWDEEDNGADTQQEEAMKFDDIANELNTLRSQPWSIQKKRKERYRLKNLLAQSQRPTMSMGAVLNKVKSGQSTVSSIFDALNILRPILQKIQSRFGQSVVAVFNLIRDLLILNFILILLLSCALIAPTMILIEDEEDQMYGWSSIYTNKTWNDENLDSGGQIDMCDHIDQGLNYTYECSSQYMNITQNATDRTTDAIGYFGDFLGGTGILERTFLFSGYYPISVDKAQDYNLSLAYLITMGLIYFISFVYVAYFLAKWVRSSAIGTMKQSMVYSTIVFSSWDFSTKEEEASKLASKLITSELKVAMDTETFLKEKLDRKTIAKLWLFVVRLFLNLIMLGVIGLGWWAIYEATRFANDQSDVTDEVQSFLLEYFPTIVVSALNFIAPILFGILVPYEKYSGRVELLITLVRSVLVRLTSLGVLFLSQFAQIIEPINDITENSIDDCIFGGEYLCWETHLGQQVYSLLVLELLIQIGMVFVVNTLRRCIGNKFSNETLKKIGNIQFYVPGHVLDVVYIQTLCWLGAIYSPLMPALAIAMLLLHFFFKMFTVFVTCLPPERIFKASRSSAMFMTVISISYALCLVPTGFAVLWITPSRSCGPFRGLNIAWEVFTYSICIIKGNAVDWIRDVIFFLDNGLFIVVVFLVIMLFAVYFSSINAAKGAYVKVLQNRMKTVTQEKRRLMDKYKNLKKRQPVKG